MPPLVSQGIFACRKTGRQAINTTGQALIPAAFFLFCCLIATLITAAHFSAAVASVSDSPGHLTSDTLQVPAQFADIPILLEKLLNQDPQIRSAASRSLDTISPDNKIPALVQVLSDPNWKIQVVAAYTLAQMGSEARSTIPALTSALDSPNPDVRFVIAKALGKIGSEAAVPPLALALQDNDENVRLAAAEGLDNLGPDAQAALPVLQKALRDGNWFVRTHAAAAFVRLAACNDSMLHVLFAALQYPLQESDFFPEAELSEIPAIVAIDALAHTPSELVPSLLAFLKDWRPEYLASLANATIALRTIQSQVASEQVVEFFLSLLNHPGNIKWSWRFDTPEKTILSALGQIGFTLIVGTKPVRGDISGAVVSSLAASLHHNCWYIHAVGLAALSQINSLDVLPYLSNAFADPDWRVRTVAAAALKDKKGGDEVLTVALQDAHWQVRLQAVRSLSQKNPVLFNLLQDQNEDVRLAAAQKVLELRGDSELAETIVIAALQNHRDTGVRLGALAALRHTRSSLAMSALIQCVRDADPKIRQIAVAFLGTAGKTAVTVLGRVLQEDDNAQVRSAAVLALRAIDSPQALSALTVALIDPDARVRESAWFFQGHFNIPLFESIKKNLQDKDWQMRRYAVEVLGGFIQADAGLADPVVQALLKALRDRNPNVRACAAYYLIHNAVDIIPNEELYSAVRDIIRQNIREFIVPLKTGDPKGRLDAIYVLGKLGSGAQTAVPALRQTLTDENWLIRYGAAVSLSRINPREQAYVPVLAEIFRDRSRLELLLIHDKYIIHDEPAALGKNGSPEAVAVLIDLLRVRDERYRYTFYYKDAVLFGGDYKAFLIAGTKAVPALAQALKNDHVRFLAANVLSRMGPRAIPPLLTLARPLAESDPALRAVFREKDADLRRSAVYALGQTGLNQSAQKKNILKKLHTICSDETETAEVRWMAVASLAVMGEDVKFSFAGMPVPRPFKDDYHLYSFDEFVHLYYDFDLYNARDLYHVGGYGGGGSELFVLVRDLLIKKSAPASTTSQPQPASIGR